MDESRRRDERLAAAGDMDAKKRLFVGRLRAGEVSTDAAALAAIIGREEALEVIGSRHEAFMADAAVSPVRVFELRASDSVGHSAAFHYLTHLGARTVAMWALDTAVRAIDMGPNHQRARDMLLAQALLDWILDDSDDNLRVVQRSRELLESVDATGPSVEEARIRVLIHALSVPNSWSGPSADAATAAVKAAIEAGDLAILDALSTAREGDVDEATANDLAEAAQRREWVRQRANLAKIALLEGAAHDEEGRPRTLLENPARNMDEDLRSLERQAAGVVARGEVDEDETAPELAGLLRAFARAEGTLRQGGDRLLEVVARAMGLDAAPVEAAYAELMRLDRLRPRPEEREIEPARETFRSLEREFQRELKKAVGITSATVAAVERDAGVQAPDLDLFHCVHGDVGEFDQHGPAYPWVRPRDFQVINIMDLASAVDDAPAGAIMIEQGGYWTGFIREAARNDRRTDAHILTAAVESAARADVVSSTWLLGLVKDATRLVESYAGFSRDQTENTLLLERRRGGGDPDEIAADHNCQNVEVWGRSLVGAWRHVTGEGAVGAVLVVARRDLVLRTAGRGAVLSNKVGDELYRWMEWQPELPAAIEDLERQGLIRVGR